MATVFLAPNGRWSARSLIGEAAAGARLYTYLTNSRIPKATFADPSGTIENTIPIILDSKGEANIYWNDDALYYIELRDVNGGLIYSQNNYPVVSGGNHTINIFEPIDNFVRNPQFTFWNNTTSFGYLGTNTAIAADWSFERSNTAAAVVINQGTFNLGQTDVEGNPIYYTHYECTDIGAAGETYKQIVQSYESVQTLADTQISFFLWAKSSTLSQISVQLEQNFGTGGSPSAPVSTTVLTQTLTANWVKYQATITLPNVGSKTLGSNGDDSLRLKIRLPLNAIADIDIATVQMQKGANSTDFIFRTKEEQEQRIKELINQALFKTGDFKTTFRSIADPGWILAASGTIGNAVSGADIRANDDTKALFKLFWNNMPNDWCPVVGGRGATAEDDFNDGKELYIPRLLGRNIAVAGSPEATFIFTATASSQTLTTARPIDYNIFSITPVTFTTTGTLPAPLAPATTYYAVYLSSTTCAIASSVVNAQNGSYITMTNTGSGVHTMNVGFTHTRSLGQFSGEDGHFPTLAELVAHEHSYSQTITQVLIRGDLNQIGVASLTQTSATTGSTGGNNAFNIISPTIYSNVMIKL